MEPDYSKEGLLRFLDYVGDKGLLNKSTAQGWRVATSKVLDDLGDAEAADVRRIDVDTAFRRFANRNPGKFSPASLQEYQRRVALALQNFVEWADSPASYKPRGKPRVKRPENGSVPRSRQGGSSSSSAPGRDEGASQVVASSGLAMPFPLRPDFLAQVVIPRDITSEEARRLGAFISTLAVDFQP